MKNLYSIKYLLITSIFIIFPLSTVSCTPPSYKSENYEEKIVLGNWSEEKLNQLMRESKKYQSVGDRIEFISSKFINTKYKDNTLIGNSSVDEVLTINLNGMDCFTYLDYVESLKQSDNFNNFKKNLVNVRYMNGNVNYKNRNHFFSDWIHNNPYIIDVTAIVSESNYKKTNKLLNKKNERELYLEGIPVKQREITYIPSDSVNRGLLNNLENGDYVGIHTNLPGLDVSHTGIIVKKENELFIRHASSRKVNRRVIDERLIDYIKNKSGIIIYRTKR